VTTERDVERTISGVLVRRNAEYERRRNCVGVRVFALRLSSSAHSGSLEDHPHRGLDVAWSARRS